MLKKSIIIANRHQTSISLEDEFFEELKAIAALRNMSLNQLVTEIDSTKNNDNLSSAIRIYILQFIKNHKS